MTGFVFAAAKRYIVARELSKMRGGIRLRYFADAMFCAYRYGASAENYFVMRLFSLNHSERMKYLTSGRSKQLDTALNSEATYSDRCVLTYKDEFDRRFEALNSRSFVSARWSDTREIRNFLKRFPEVVVKPVCGTQGRGIRKLRTADIADHECFAESCVARKLLLEEPICQHPLLMRINPSSVNTVRVNAIRTNAGVKVLGSALRCGEEGSTVDNFHSGAVAYPLDENGVVCGSGRDNKSLVDYMFHPSSGLRMPGIKIPFWDELLRAVELAMDFVPSMGYVGWDIAVTESGIEIIEGNYNWPGGNVIQLDGAGKYPLALKYLNDSL